MSVNFTGNVSGLRSAAGAAQGILSKIGQGDFAGAAVTGLALIAGAAIGVGVSSVKAAGAFQQSMLKVSAYAGLSKQQTDDLGNSVLTAAAKFGVAPQQMADALYPVISSGYNASQAMDILSLSAKTSAASGANLATVADMLTTSLKASGAPASQAGHYMDMFNKIVSLGKGEVPQYAATIGKLTLAAGGAKIPFDQMGAALATLTTHGFPSVAQASTALGNLFTQIGPKVDTLTKNAKKLGLSFDENKFKTADLTGKLKMLQDATHGNDGALLKLLGGSTLAKKAFDALTKSGKDLSDNMKAMKNSAGATDAAYKTASTGLNASMNRMKSSLQVVQIQIGEKLLPVLTKIVDFVTPIIGKFSDWISSSNGLKSALAPLQTIFEAIAPYIKKVSDAFDALFMPTQKLTPVMKPLTDTFDRATAVFSKFNGVAAPLTDTFDRATGYFNKFSNAGKKVGETVSPLKKVVDVIMQLGKAALNMDPLVNIIEGVARHGKELGDWWQKSVIPAIQQATPGFKNLGQALAGLAPAFLKISDAVHGSFQKSFDAFLPVFKEVVPLVIKLAGVLANDLGNAIKVITPSVVQAAKALAEFSSDIATRVAPIIKGFFDELNKDMPALKAIWNTIWPELSTSLSAVWNSIKGTVQIAWAIVTGIIKVGLDVMSGNWKQAWTDVKDTLSGIWEGIKTIFGGAIDAAISDFNRFKNGIVQAAQNLYDTLVGHSIIPDMVNGIVAWIAQLPGRAGAAFQDMSNRAMSILNNLASTALTAGTNIVTQIANGITAGIGAVGDAIGRVTSFIASHLPQSPAKRGVLRALPTMGATITKQIGQGMVSGLPAISSAMARITNPIMSLAGPTGSSGVYSTTSSAAMSAGSSGSASGGAHTTIIEFDGRAIAEYTQSYSNKQVRLKLGPKGRLAA